MSADLLEVFGRSAKNAEERIAQLSEMLGQTTIELSEAEEAFRKLQNIQYATECPGDFIFFDKKKKSKPTWSPGFGAPVRRGKK